MKKLLGLLLLSATAIAGPRTALIEQNTGGLLYRNFVKNPGAERQITFGITDSSGIATRTTTTPIEGAAEFTIDATSSGQQVDWALNTQDQGLKSAACEARWVIEGDATLYKLQVLSGTTVVAENTTLTNYATPQTIVLPVPCGDLSTTYKLRIESTSASAAAILVDSVYYGRATNLSTVTQATLYGTASAYAAASCNWSTASASFAAFAADTDCLTPTVTGGLSAPATKIPAFKMLAAPPGKYLVTATFQIQSSTGNPSYALSDGTTTVSKVQSESAGTQRIVTMVGVFEYTTAGDRQIDVQGRAGGANAELTANSAFMDLSFTVQKFPTQSQIITQDQVNTDWATYSVTIGGVTSAPTKGTTTIDKAQWRRVGQNMEIRYQYKQTGAGSAGSGDYLFPIPSGYTIDTTNLNVNGDQGSSVGFGSFYDGTTGRETSMILYSTTQFKMLGLNGTNYSYIGSGTGALSNTAVSFSFTLTVPITGWVTTQTYYIPGSVVSANSGQIRHEVAELNCDAGSAVTTGSWWLSALGNRSTGSCTATILAGIFSAAPYACGMTIKGSTVQSTAASISSATSVTFTGPSSDWDGFVWCDGPR